MKTCRTVLAIDHLHVDASIADLDAREIAELRDARLDDASSDAKAVDAGLGPEHLAFDLAAAQPAVGGAL